MKRMLYYNTKNREKLFAAIIEEARKLGVGLVRCDLDRSYDYKTNAYQNLEQLISVIVEDIRDWFSNDNLSVKEMDVGIHNLAFSGGEFVRVQTRRKR